MVKPASKKAVVEYVMTRFTLSERAACKLVGLARTTYRYQPKKRDEESLVTRLKELAMAYPRYGYLLLHGLLKRERLVVNKKRTYRLYTEQGLQVRTKQRKKLVRPRLVMDRPTAVNQRWSMDFVSDQLATGRRFRVLNIVDDFSREMVGQLVSISISGHQVARYLSELIEVRGKPEAIVCETEFGVAITAQNTPVKPYFFGAKCIKCNSILSNPVSRRRMHLWKV